MTLDVLVAEMLALGRVEAMAPGERSAESLALTLAHAAERVRTDPMVRSIALAVRQARGMVTCVPPLRNDPPSTMTDVRR